MKILTDDPAVTIQRRGVFSVVCEKHGYLLGHFPEHESKWEWICEAEIAPSLVINTRFPTPAAALDAFRLNRLETVQGEQDDQSTAQVGGTSPPVARKNMAASSEAQAANEPKSESRNDPTHGAPAGSTGPAGVSPKGSP